MVVHIVTWKIKDGHEGLNKAQIMEKMKKDLEGLKDKVPTIQKIEVGYNFNKANDFDVVLYSEFQDKEGLSTYQDHPEHLKVASFVRSVALNRVCVDYEK
ncbi:MAG: Dabb family protein [Clostridiaceae bacterium]|nr:Dabb family protein [Clostridiaceae bacterium]